MDFGAVSAWVGIAITIGGFIYGYGRVTNRLERAEKDIVSDRAELEKRLDKMENRQDHTDEALKAVIRMEEQIKHLVSLMEVAQIKPATRPR